MPVLVILSISCSGQKESEDLQESIVQTGFLQLADQIIYDVIIKNPDPQDEWREKCLGGLKRGELVDFIFDGLYDDRFKAYDIFNDKLIPAHTIRSAKYSLWKIGISILKLIPCPKWLRRSGWAASILMDLGCTWDITPSLR